MNRSTSFVIDSDSDGGCAARLSVRDDLPSPVVTTRRSFRITDMDESAYEDPYVAREPDPCGGDRVGEFAIRADDEACLIEVRVRVLLLPQDEPAIQLGEYWADRLHVSTRPEYVREKAEVWRDAIRRKWSRQHRIRTLEGGCPCEAYGVDIDVEFQVGEEERSSPHHEVLVHPESGRTDSGDLYMMDDADIAAHEFGHWIGHADEYPGGGILPSPFQEVEAIFSEGCRILTDPSSIMNEASGRVYLYHYRHFARWLASTRCCEVEEGRIEDVGVFFESPA